MPRWRQSYNEETGKSEFIPIDDAARAQASSPAVHGDVQSFVSPVDGSVITDRAQLREHNKRNRVENIQEFQGAEFDKMRQERARVLRGEHTKEEKFKRKQELYEVLTRAERNGR